MSKAADEAAILSSWKEGKTTMSEQATAGPAISPAEAVTPPRVLAAVNALLAQAPADEQRIPLSALVNHLLHETGCEEAARAQAFLSVRRAILRALRQLPALGCSGGG